MTGNSELHYELIVVGGGHAGVEAALAGARMGCRTLLLTQSMDTLGQMSCNPAIGGIGKSQLVREVDALDGVMARAADEAGIQLRVLNSRKGPAVRATRAQADRALYRRAIRRLLDAQPGLYLFQQAVRDLLVEGDRVTGVVTQLELRFTAPVVILATGTFLGGRIHVGDQQYEGGRAGDPPANALARRLRELPFQVGRLKTGTPPRLDARTVDFRRLCEQPGDIPPPALSFLGRSGEAPAQRSCYIAHTNGETRAIVSAALHQSAMYSGAIKGVGPRYCPSIEDKFVRFADKETHQIFLEPEGLDSGELYPNGISTSLPFAVQQRLVRSVEGLEKAHITRPGYAIEYDFFDPRGLRRSLETRALEGLFFAGQINGTTGYEEAAAQGILAGINGALKVRDKEPWYPQRGKSYLGVMVDDLSSQGVLEPYRMFTSRAEYRLLLREDNADSRLTETGHALGVVGEYRWRRFCEKQEALAREKQALETLRIPPARMAGLCSELGAAELPPQSRALTLLRRPELSYQRLCALLGRPACEESIGASLEADIKYAGYIVRQQKEISRVARRENTAIPRDMDYAHVPGLSHEVRQRLTEQAPRNMGEAMRIPGITPAAITLLLAHLSHWRELPRSA